MNSKMSLNGKKLEPRRLTLQYKATGIKLTSQYNIKKVLIPSNLRRIWYLVTSNKENIIYCKDIPNTIQTNIE